MEERNDERGWERTKRRAAAARRRKKQMLKVRLTILGVLVVALLALIILLVKVNKSHTKSPEPVASASTMTETPEGEDPSNYESEGIPLEGQEQGQTQANAPAPGSRDDIVMQAKAKATQYDYEGAIELLNTVENIQNDSEVSGLISEYQTALSSLVATDPHNVTHVFFHTLVVDPDRGFSLNDTPGWNSGTEGFCEWMTTVDEFNRMMQAMYDRGYVLISLYDMVEETVGADGQVHISPKNIMLPEGKTPFVLSLDDLSYYHSYDGRGCATKMIIGDNGRPTCEYVDAAGNTLVGSYDCVPLLDDFLDVHPDFSYKGAKGTIAFTGYNGIFGYRTDYCYRDRVELTADQEAWLAIHPEYNWETECANAKAVADCVKADGWTFASHTWGHMRIGDADYSRVVADTEKWITYVKPLLGEVDCIIFAHGQDLPGWGADYATSDKFQYMKSQGFNLFCNVDSSQYFVDYGDTFFRMGRRNLDGYRLYQAVFNGDDRVSDLFDANEIWDQRRPTDPELYDLM